MSRRNISDGVRYRIMRRDGFRCRYCGRSASETRLHIDHAQPVSAGGSDDPLNLITACEGCNLGKGASVPEWYRCRGSWADPRCTRNIDDPWIEDLEWEELAGWWGCFDDRNAPNPTHQEPCA